MKFSNGAWLMKSGVEPYYTNELRSYEISEQLVTLYAPFQAIRHRGDTLTGPLFTIEFSSPAEEVIKLKITHHKQRKAYPAFELNESTNVLKTIDSAQYLEISTGKTTVKIHKDTWLIEYFYNKKLLTFSSGRSLGMMMVNQDKHMCESLNLSVGEKIYGLGERFTNFIRN